MQFIGRFAQLALTLIGAYPPPSMNSRPACAPADDGSVSATAVRSSWPRGG